MSELFQCGDRPLNRGDNMRVNRPSVRRRDAKRDPQFLWLTLCELRPGTIGSRRSVGVAWKASSDRIKISGAVPNGSCIAESKSAAMPDVASRTRRKPAARRLQSNDPAARCGDANRSRCVGRLGDRNHTGSDRGRRSTARAARQSFPRAMGSSSRRRAWVPSKETNRFPARLICQREESPPP